MCEGFACDESFKDRIEKSGPLLDAAADTMIFTRKQGTGGQQGENPDRKTVVARGAHAPGTDKADWSS